uniref:C-type lectin domain-containing protein n=1 Tax=Labrus bergylta TaxID=56723 RepID=A0A3Q3FJF4_9LABR
MERILFTALILISVSSLSAKHVFISLSVTWPDAQTYSNGLYSSLLTYGIFCFNLMVDEVKKTWEEALEHCRETHTDLTSLNSETERRLALSEIQHDRITKRVWIGLRFLGDRWLWVDGDPLVYEAWPEGDQEMSPKLDCMFVSFHFYISVYPSFPLFQAHRSPGLTESCST